MGALPVQDRLDDSRLPALLRRRRPSAPQHPQIRGQL